MKLKAGQWAVEDMSLVVGLRACSDNDIYSVDKGTGNNYNITNSGVVKLTLLQYVKAMR